MISREGTVNLSNMNALSEDVYGAPSKESDSTASALAKWMSTLTFGAVGSEPAANKWKITKFATTPLVSLHSALVARADRRAGVDLPCGLREW
jgi:aminopeptidase 2